ncbi:hypothetical protein CY34DRAFT_814527 [Suillus luteus UH-Slu-Lm8-n1]|uniref:Uncharacterized protein n=1 Tax=Suillus luteus UH-Slu-Lm8-n1 TaxID=930992 RepID=A0A0D0AIC4_9AGAM|nr:hypothetical protein CY34DRAFT_814527 [Suillus luteus UH-Slu-Lm8-n1]
MSTDITQRPTTGRPVCSREPQECIQGRYKYLSTRTVSSASPGIDTDDNGRPVDCESVSTSVSLVQASTFGFPGQHR